MLFSPRFLRCDLSWHWLQIVCPLLYLGCLMHLQHCWSWFAGRCWKTPQTWSLLHPFRQCKHTRLGFADSSFRAQGHLPCPAPCCSKGNASLQQSTLSYERCKQPKPSRRTVCGVSATSASRIWNGQITVCWCKQNSTGLGNSSWCTARSFPYFT